MKVSRSEPISLTCLQPEQSLITLFYRRVAPLLVYLYNDLNIEKDMKLNTSRRSVDITKVYKYVRS
jgi:hypothetical protein